MVIQIYIIHMLCYDTVKHCECVKIVQNTHFQLIDQTALFNINSSETTMLLVRRLIIIMNIIIINSYTVTLAGLALKSATRM